MSLLLSKRWFHGIASRTALCGYGTSEPTVLRAGIMGKRAGWLNGRFWLGMACSTLFLFLAFRNVQWTELWAVLQGVNWVYMSAAIGLYILILVVRGFRWWVLLTPLGPTTAWDAFTYINIGYMANDLLPLRAGEVIRAVLLGEKKSISKSAVLATIVVERLLDILAVVVLAFILMLVMPIPLLVKQAVLVAGGLGSLAVIGLWWAAGRSLGMKIESSLTSCRSLHFCGIDLKALAHRGLELAWSFSSGLAVLRSPGQVIMTIGYSILAWGLGVGFTVLVMETSHLALPWTASILVIVVVNLGAVIPSSPGFIGVVHFLAMTALLPWAVEQAAALGFAIVYHAIPFLTTVLLGLLFLWSEGFGLKYVTQTGVRS